MAGLAAARTRGGKGGRRGANSAEKVRSCGRCCRPNKLGDGDLSDAGHLSRDVLPPRECLRVIPIAAEGAAFGAHS
jgi:hypothetical protein